MMRFECLGATECMSSIQQHCKGEKEAMSNPT